MKQKLFTIIVKALYLLILGVFFHRLAFGYDLPEMGNTADQTISPYQERQIGASIHTQFLNQKLLINDPIMSDYIQALGYRLLGGRSRLEHEFVFFMVNDQQINAFALPGAFIGINTGLMLLSETESELAAVIAHEIAHVTQRHIARRFSHSKNMTIPVAAAVLAAILIGHNSGEAGSAAFHSAIAGSMQSNINFTRSNEREADAIGMQLLVQADFDPTAMANFFERLQQGNRYYSFALPEYLSTHPITTNRIAEAKNRAQIYANPTPALNIDYEIAKARLRVLTHKNLPQLTRELKNELDSGRYADELATRYSYILALIGSEQFDPINEQLAKIPFTFKDHPVMILATAELELATNRADRALNRLEDALLLYPGQRPLVLAYAKALIEHGNPNAAVTLLREHLHNHDKDLRAYQLYARAEKLSDNLAEALFAQAEYHLILGDLKTSIQKLKSAEKVEGIDYFQSARIQARLTELNKLKAAHDKQKIN